MNNLRLNQKLWVKPSNRREPYQAKIVKIGHKYFEIDEYPRRLYFIENLKQFTKSKERNELFLSYNDMIHADDLARSFKAVTPFFTNKRVTYTQMKKICDILGVDMKKLVPKKKVEKKVKPKIDYFIERYLEEEYGEE